MHILKKIFLCVLLIFNILVLNLNADCAFADLNNLNINKKFEPKSPVLTPDKLKNGDFGYMLTVLEGREPVKIPVKITSVISQNASSVGDYILIKILKHELARGMSGSPVYIRRGRREFLIGAVSIGWDFSDHTLALVTPIGDMCRIFENSHLPAFADILTNHEDLASHFRSASPADSHSNIAKLSQILPISTVTVSGMSHAAATKMCEKIGVKSGENSIFNINSSVKNNMNKNIKINTDYKFRPGDAIAVMLAWGDIEVSATGTVTEISRFDDGRFLAFGHPFLKRGNACFPAALAHVHATVNSTAFPFKIATPECISGTIMCDKEAGIGGKSGFFTQSVNAELNFKNLDTGESVKRSFRVINDEFLAAKILEGAYAGLIEDVWGRKGQGTMSVNLRVDGAGIRNGWTRKNIFYDNNNIETASLQEPVQIITAIMTQPFTKNKLPPAFRLDIEAVSEPKALFIEDLESPESVKAGDEFEVKVKLRAWRGDVIMRKFKLKMPEDATGTYELFARGGGTQPSSQLAIEGGWKSIDSLELMLREIAALDANNELILELQGDAVGELINKINQRVNKGVNKSASKNSNKNVDNDTNKNADNVNNTKISKTDDKLLLEEQEFLSQTKERRIKAGTMRIFRSDYFVDGLLRRVIEVEGN